MRTLFLCVQPLYDFSLLLPWYSRTIAEKPSPFWRQNLCRFLMVTGLPHGSKNPFRVCTARLEDDSARRKILKPTRRSMQRVLFNQDCSVARRRHGLTSSSTLNAKLVSMSIPRALEVFVGMLASTQCGPMAERPVAKIQGAADVQLTGCLVDNTIDARPTWDGRSLLIARVIVSAGP